jgi:hypothetical protein
MEDRLANGGDEGIAEHEAWTEEIEESLGKEYMIMIMTNFTGNEELVQALDLFKEQVEAKVTAFEGVINKAVKDDWFQTETELTTNQHMRNRDIIKEIVNNTEVFRKANRERFSKWREEDNSD